MSPENENPGGRPGRSLQRRGEQSLPRGAAATSRNARFRAAAPPPSDPPEGGLSSEVESRWLELFPGLTYASAPGRAAYAILSILELRQADGEGLIERERLVRCVRAWGHPYAATETAFMLLLYSHVLALAWHRRSGHEFVGLAGERVPARGRAA